MAFPKQIVVPSTVDMSQLTFGMPKKLESGGRLVPVFYQGAPFVIQTPSMRVPYGMNAWTQEKKNGEEYTKYSINLSLDTNSDLGKMLNAMDERIVQDACQNSLPWLNKKNITPEVAKALYTPMVKLSKDKETGEVSDKYPPTFKLAMPFADGRFTCEIYDTQRQPIALDTIPKRSTVTAICQCTGIWVAGGKFGCNWKAVPVSYTHLTLPTKA